MEEKYKDIEQLLISKLFSDLLINDVQKIQLLRIVENFNKKNIRNNYLTIRSFIIYNVDGDWLDRMNRIKNEFHRDSSSLESFKCRFGDEFGHKKWDEKTKSTTQNLENFIKKFGEKKGKKEYDKYKKSKTSIGLDIMIKRHGEEGGKKRWDEYLKKWRIGIKNRKESFPWKNGLTLEEYIQRYGERKGNKLWQERKKWNVYTHSKQYYLNNYGQEEGEKRWETYCKNHNVTSLESFVKRYGEKDGTEKYNAHVIKMTYINSKEYYIDIYGAEEGIIKYQEKIKKCIAHNIDAPNYSKISQELFWSVYEKLSDNQKELSWFAELNQEFIFYVHRDNVKIIMTDFRLCDRIIEFDGDYWHSLERVKIKDKIKRKILSEMGCNILVIKESDYKNNKEQIVKKCIKYLKKYNNEFKYR